MRKLVVPLTLAGLVALTLVGCSPADTAADCTRASSPADSAIDLVTVTGDIDSAPTVDMYKPVHTDATVWKDLVVGTGTALQTDEQLVVVDLSLFSGTTGASMASTAYDGDLSDPRQLTAYSATLPGLTEIVECAREGGRVVGVIAPDGIDPQIAERVGLAPDESMVVVVDLRKVYLAKANGADQLVTGSGIPAVVRAENGRPGILIPDGNPPSELTVRVLKKGSGAEVTGEVPVRVAYTGMTWKDRKIFETTWDAVPASLELDKLIPGFAEGLKGQTVGSQVLLVIPPELGYGDAGNSKIAAGSTLVFVVDILGLDTPSSP